MFNGCFMEKVEFIITQHGSSNISYEMLNFDLFLL